MMNFVAQGELEQNEETQTESHELRNSLIGGSVILGAMAIVAVGLYKNTKDKVVNIRFIEGYNNCSDKSIKETYKKNSKKTREIFEGKYYEATSDDAAKKDNAKLNRILKKSDKEIVDWFLKEFVDTKSDLAFAVYFERNSLLKKCSEEKSSNEEKYKGLKEKLEEFETFYKTKESKYKEKDDVLKEESKKFEHFNENEEKEVNED